ncbi:HNH endonuclease signature motif containing protein [Pseudoclavibacter soli]|uniref:HNH endonuclease signature motif containing protein n=1 Tax=Pseudoclavibacter soli TaxID=452623 RepID=UPI000410D6E0|nr:HNH endonuclease signature motif containing protein [Pseudoclavibacter soli]
MNAKAHAQHAAAGASALAAALSELNAAAERVVRLCVRADQSGAWGQSVLAVLSGGAGQPGAFALHDMAGVQVVHAAQAIERVSRLVSAVQVSLAGEVQARCQSPELEPTPSAAGAGVGVGTGTGTATTTEAAAVVDPAKTPTTGAAVNAAASAGEWTVPGQGSAVAGAATDLREVFGVRTASALLQQACGVGARVARGRIRLAEQVLPRRSDTGMILSGLHPRVGAAMFAGAISVETAQVIVGELQTVADRAHPDDLAAAEAHLVAEASFESPTTADAGDAAVSEAASAPELAAKAGLSVKARLSAKEGLSAKLGLSPELVRVQAQAWRDALDPDGVEPKFDTQLRRRYLSISATPRDGMHSISGAIPPDVAAKALAILGALTTPRRSTGRDSAVDLASGLGDVPADKRTVGERRADAFAAMVAALSNDTTMFTTPPSVIITTSATSATSAGTLASSPGRISGIAELVPPSVIAQLADDGGVQHAQSDPRGAVVALSSAQRVFTASQRKAMVARDGHECVIPGCRIPAIGCEAHHVTAWQHGGRTSIDNGVLLCWWHHRTIDTGPWRIDMQHRRPVITHKYWRGQCWQPSAHHATTVREISSRGTQIPSPRHRVSRHRHEVMQT